MALRSATDFSVILILELRKHAKNKKQKGAGRGESTRLDEGAAQKATKPFPNHERLARNPGGNPERKRGPGEEQNKGEGSRTHLR